MTANGARALAAYHEVKVTSRSPLELVVMLYDGALSSLRLAHVAMCNRDLVTKRDAMKKALEIVQHLQSSLNMEEGGEVAIHLDALYRDVVSRVLEANVCGTPQLLEEAIRLMATVGEAWGTLASTPLFGEPKDVTTGTFVPR